MGRGGKVSDGKSEGFRSIMDDGLARGDVMAEKMEGKEWEPRRGGVTG